MISLHKKIRRIEECTKIQIFLQYLLKIIEKEFESFYFLRYGLINKFLNGYNQRSGKKIIAFKFKKEGLPPEHLLSIKNRAKFIKMPAFLLFVFVIHYYNLISYESV